MNDKNKILREAIGKIVVLLLILAIAIVAMIGEMKPGSIPGWLSNACWICSIPCGIALIMMSISKHGEKRASGKGKKRR